MQAQLLLECDRSDCIDCIIPRKEPDRDFYACTSSTRAELKLLLVRKMLSFAGNEFLSSEFFRFGGIFSSKLFVEKNPLFASDNFLRSFLCCSYKTRLSLPCL